MSDTSRALALVPSEPELQSMMTVAKAMHESGCWPDVKSVAQAFVRVQAGREWGIPPFMAMSSVHIIQGKPTMAAHAIAAKIKGSGKYDFRVKELTATACALEFYQGGQLVGTERFTIEDAKTANLTGKDIWRAYAKNMLFARAISNGAKFYCADIFGGAVYTPEEMGAPVTAEGEVISTPAEPVQVEARIVETEPVQQAATPAPTYTCTDCDKSIGALKTKKGTLTAAEVAERTRKAYGRQLCYPCSEREQAKLDREAHEAAVAGQAEQVEQEAF